MKTVLKKGFNVFYSLPGFLWLVAFFVVPTFIIVIYSFFTPGLYGGAELPFTMGSYIRIFTSAGFWNILWRTIYISAISTLLCLGLALPVSYFIATSKNKNFLLNLVIIPFWTNFLLRIFGWMVILGSNGLINTLFLNLGIIESPMNLLYRPWSVVLVIIYMYLPYMIFPIYSSIEKFNFNLLEAAMDLGATRVTAFWKILIPSIKGGIAAGVLLVFIPALGSYAIPQLVGGTEGSMLGNLIARELMVSRNWPSSSAISMVFLIITTFGLFVYMRINNRKNKLHRNTSGEIMALGEKGNG